MDLLNIIQRNQNPAPWSEDDKIPWHEPEFSRRMLVEHLTQDHDAASRRSERIDSQVSWINETLLDGKPSDILDLGCGPGLYTSRLASLGHRCLGIDFSPAAIQHARERAAARDLPCEYIHQDIRAASYGTGHQLAMLLFGEFNVFRREEIANILTKAYQSLDPGGVLLLEPHTFAAVKEMGQETPTWSTSPHGLFSNDPHVTLRECFWDDGARAAMQRYYIIHANTGAVSRYGQTINAYDQDGYRQILSEVGFEDMTIGPSMGEDKGTVELMVITARKT
jgi:SAM-dependent methyltransferase